MISFSSPSSLRVLMLSAIIQMIYFIWLPLCVTMDSPFYLGAGWIQAHHLYFPVQDVRTPGYSTFLSAFFLFTPNLLVVSLAQHLLIAAVSGLCTRVLSERTSAWSASLCGLFIGVTPSLGFYSSFMMSDVLFSTLLIAFVLGIIGSLGKSPRLFSWLGVLGGLMTLVRPNGLLIVLISAIILYPFLPGGSSPRSGQVPFEQRYSFRILFWCFATVLPWLAYRGAVTGHIGMLAPNRSASLQMEMVLGISGNAIEEYVDPPFKTEVRRLKQDWDLRVAAEKPGVSFYYYLNPELIILFGQDRVSEFYKEFLWRYFRKNPGILLRRAALTVLNLALLLPPSVADTFVETPDVTSGDILGCATDSLLYREAKRVCSFEPFEEQLTGLISPIRESTLRGLLTTARYVIFIVSWLAVFRIGFKLLAGRFNREEKAFIFICAMGIGITVLGYAWLLKPSSRYAIPLQSLSVIGLTMTFSRKERQ